MAGPLVRLRLRVSCGGLFGGRRGVVHHVLQFLAWLEIRNLLGGHLDAGSSLRIAPDAGLPLARAEATKAADLDLVTAAQGFHDAVEDGLDDDLRLLAGHFHYARDLFNQIRLGHVHASLCKLRKTYVRSTDYRPQQYRVLNLQLQCWFSLKFCRRPAFRPSQV